MQEETLRHNIQFFANLSVVPCAGVKRESEAKIAFMVALKVLWVTFP